MRLAPLSLLILLAGLALGVQANDVLVVSSEQSPAYQEATEAVVAELARREVVPLPLSELPAYSGPGPRLYVAPVSYTHLTLPTKA